MIRPLDAVYAAGLALTAPVWGINLIRTGKWRTDWRGRRGYAPDLPSSDLPTVLLHGVSVGEVVAAEPLVRRLEREGCRVVISATTDTGTARAETLFGDRHTVVRFPLDFSWMTERFLDRIGPDAVGLLELEVWPHFMRSCESRGIPVTVVNGRLSESSFGGYIRVRRLVAPVFRKLRWVGAQTRAYADRFRALGVPSERVEITGTMKWDVQLPDDLEARAERMRAELDLPLAAFTIVAISTGPDEERALLEVVPDDVTLVVVPRKPERFEEVAALTGWRRRTTYGSASLDADGGSSGDGMAGSAPIAAAPRALIDTMGEAEVATALADLVVVGRTFNGMGGSNPIPAAQMGKPIAIGPDHHNFADVVQALTARTAERPGAARVVERISDLRALLGDRSALEAMAAAGPAIVRAHRGATARNADLLLRMLPGAAPGRVHEAGPGEPHETAPGPAHDQGTG